LRINTDIFGFIESEKLKELMNSDEGLKSFIDQEIDRMKDEDMNKSCGGCGKDCGCGCSHSEIILDTGYLTTALMSIFNYYIPDNVKDAIHLGGTTFIEN
jgi:hypothetical protein